MSYSGTVHCSWCGERGHNRLGCPKRRKEALKDPDSYVGRQWHREQAQRRKQVESRVCSYCKESGHNRRGCKVLKEDKVLVSKRQSDFIHHFAEVSSSVGLGPGSLVKVSTSRGSGADPWARGFVGMVTEFAWPNIDFAIQDINHQSEWRLKEQRLASVRVVSSFGYTDEENYWNAPPKFNEIQWLNTLHLREILGDAIRSDGYSDLDVPAQLVGPVYKGLTLPLDPGQVTVGLNSRFNLDPGPRADDWDKRRTSFDRQHWRHVRPDEYAPVENTANGW